MERKVALGLEAGVWAHRVGCLVNDRFLTLSDGGRLMRQGSWVTVLLWLLAVGLHLVVDSGNGVGGATLLLYLGLTLGTQQVVVQWRARRMRVA